MIIIRDTREGKNPKTGRLNFEHEYVTGIVDECLTEGDYRGRYKGGKESRVIIERKSINDLWGTLSDKDRYRRFRQEIERAREANNYLIICIEGTYTKIQKGFDRGFRPGSAIANQLRTIWFKYGVSHVYCKDRTEMSKYIVDTFIWCGRKKLWV